MNAPAPTNTTEFKSFLGMCQFSSKFLIKPGNRDSAYEPIVGEAGGIPMGYSSTKLHSTRPKNSYKVIKFLYTMIRRKK